MELFPRDQTEETSVQYAKTSPFSIPAPTAPKNRRWPKAVVSVYAPPSGIAGLPESPLFETGRTFAASTETK